MIGINQLRLVAAQPRVAHNLIVRFHKLAFSCYPPTPSTIVAGGMYDPPI